MKRIQDKITELSKKPSTNADTIAVLRMCQKRIEQLEQESGEKAALLAEVNNNRTGKSPCARFCEALAAKKMFDNLRTERDQLAAQVERLLEIIKYYQQGQVASDDAMSELIARSENTPAQCLAEVRAQAAKDAVNYVFDYIMADFDVEPVANEITLTPKYLNEYRSQILSGYVNQIRQQAEGV